MSESARRTGRKPSNPDFIGAYAFPAGGGEDADHLPDEPLTW